ncbi:MAG: ROK family protein [Candidatus Saccharimonadales bacterium]|nr:ROK family protein [Candidatus Saccharimonadales bacterium]
MYIAVDIGGTKTLVAKVDDQGQIVTEKKCETIKDFDEFMEKLFGAIEEVAGNMDEVHAIGVAAPGLVDKKTKTLKIAGHLPWIDADIVTPLAEKYSKPALIDNDANLGALSEAVAGAGKDFREVLYITVSTGIGTGVVYDGVVDPSLADSEGGMMHFRHDGKLMLWEAFASGSAFVERFGAMGKDVDDPEIWKQYAEDLSLGFGSLIAVIQPEVIVVGGSMGEHLHKYHAFLVDALTTTKARTVRIPQIVEAKDAHRAVVNGCYVMAKQAHERN